MLLYHYVSASLIVVKASTFHSSTHPVVLLPPFHQSPSFPWPCIALSVFGVCVCVCVLVFMNQGEEDTTYFLSHAVLTQFLLWAQSCH